MSESERLTESERDDDLAMELTQFILVAIREKGLQGTVHWDGCELLCSWRERSADDL